MWGGADASHGGCGPGTDGKRHSPNTILFTKYPFRALSTWKGALSAVVFVDSLGLQQHMHAPESARVNVETTPMCVQTHVL